MDDREYLRQAIQSTVVITGTSGARIINADERTLSSWILDFRALLLQPEWLDRYAELFWEHFAPQYPFQVCGMESAGIAPVAAILMKSVERGTPVNGLFIRKSRKRIGLLKQVEGTINAHPIVLVDDLINSGSTFNKQIKILHEAGATVSDIFALVRFRDVDSYSFPDALNVRITTPFSLQDFGMDLKAAGKDNIHDAFQALWRFRAPDPEYNYVLQKSSPILDESKVYFGSDAGRFFALDQTTGDIAWTFDVKGGGKNKQIFSSPAIHGDLIYFGANDGAVHALERSSGKERWTYEDADWVNSSPAIARRLKLLFIGLEFGLIRKRGGLVALHTDTGKKLWEVRVRAAVMGSPLYIQEENMVIIGDNNGVVYALNAITGAPLWQYHTKASILSSFVYDPVKRAVIFGSMDSILYSLDVRNGKAIFEKKTAAGGIRSTPLLKDRIIYFSSLDKLLYALDADTGENKWSFATKGRIFASPTFEDGSVWIGSNDGKLYELDSEKGTLKGFFQATERIVNKPVYNPDTRCFFVPTQANELYCLKRNT